MDIKDNDFEEKVIQQSNEKPVVVDFWADWCVPCNVLAPLLEKVVNSYDDKVVLMKVNVDECPETSKKFDIDAIPCVKVFKDGKVVGEFVGVATEDVIKQEIGKAL